MQNPITRASAAVAAAKSIRTYLATHSKMLHKIVLASLVLGIIASSAPQAPAAADQPIPKTGDNGKPNGVFSFDFGKGGAGSGKARLSVAQYS